MFGPHGGVLGAWDCGWPPGEKVAGGTGNSGFLPSLLKNERNLIFYIFYINMYKLQYNDIDHLICLFSRNFVSFYAYAHV